MPSSQPYAVTNPGPPSRSTLSCPTTVFAPIASGTLTRNSPSAAMVGVARLRLSVRWLVNELMPPSETPLTSTIRAAGRNV
jgi:hypothetical protein